MKRNFKNLEILLAIPLFLVLPHLIFGQGGTILPLTFSCTSNYLSPNGPITINGNSLNSTAVIEVSPSEIFTVVVNFYDIDKVCEDAALTKCNEILNNGPYYIDITSSSNKITIAKIDENGAIGAYQESFSYLMAIPSEYKASLHGNFLNARLSIKIGSDFSPSDIAGVDVEISDGTSEPDLEDINHAQVHWDFGFRQPGCTAMLSVIDPSSVYTKHSVQGGTSNNVNFDLQLGSFPNNTFQNHLIQESFMQEFLFTMADVQESWKMAVNKFTGKPIADLTVADMVNQLSPIAGGAFIANELGQIHDIYVPQFRLLKSTSDGKVVERITQNYTCGSSPTPLLIHKTEISYNGNYVLLDISKQ